ncbi:MAG TPA: FHA domain-containing protein [Thermoanaerobaculia bacterium]|nr:FHA domain-containing protein [Thermoanaerobaculia bacterium]
MNQICPKCKTPNRDQAKYCLSCNAPLTADTPVRYCPSGRHPMDPGWETCPYCAASDAWTTRPSSQQPGAQAPPPLPPPLPGQQRQPTMVEGAAAPAPRAAAAAPPRPAPPPPPPPAGGGSSRRKTVFATENEGGPAVSPGMRRIVAVLVTYTWRADGEMFAVREGRNYLGSSLECEIHLASDPQMSARHATILYRGKDFWIDDEKSMNGTYVNGEVIEEKQRLSDHATIRTGATVWHFVILAPGAGE